MNMYRRGDEVFGVTNLPRYKKPVLYVGNGCVIRKIASFGSKEDAEEFCEMLNRWFGFEKGEQKCSGSD